MAAKTATILARVEPGIKEQAEAIMDQLGVPASVVINMLYKQIIMTRSIPFSLALPTVPAARDELDAGSVAAGIDAKTMMVAAFDAMMARGLEEAKAGRARPAPEVFSQLRREIGE